MKFTLAIMILASTLSAGCTTVVMTDVVEPRPVVIAETYHGIRPIVNYIPAPIITPVIVPYCNFVETPVYGYADVYRDGYTHVRIGEVAHINQQRRCN